MPNGNRHCPVPDHSEFPGLFKKLHDSFPLPPGEEGQTNSCLVQYWNDEPDDQVKKLLHSVRDCCNKAGMEWRLFSEQDAYDYIEKHFDGAYKKAFERCLHHAQRSDLFRYCYLYHSGGLWLDADVGLQGSPRIICHPSKPVLYLRERFLGRLSSMLMWSPPGGVILKEILETSVAKINNDEIYDECRRRRDILSLSGPKVVNDVVVRHVARHLSEGGGSEPPVYLVNEDVFYELTVSAKEFLGEELKYKRTDRAWQKWAEEIPDSPISLFKQGRRRRKSNSTSK